MQIMISLLMASMLFIMIPRAQASADRINEVLAIEPEVRDPAVPRRDNGEKGHVEFRDGSSTLMGARMVRS